MPEKTLQEYKESSLEGRRIKANGGRKSATEIDIYRSIELKSVDSCTIKIDESPNRVESNTDIQFARSNCPQEKILSIVRNDQTKTAYTEGFGTRTTPIR